MNHGPQDLQAKLRKIARVIARERNLLEALSTLVQRTVLQVLKKAEQDRLHGRSSDYREPLSQIPTQLLYRICANSANDLLRRKGTELRALEQHARAPARASLSPEDLVMALEDHRLLAELLAALECYRAQPGLSKKQAQIRDRSVRAFTMVRLAQCTTRETATRLRAHRSQVRADIARVENFLRKRLARRLEDEVQEQTR